MRQYPEHIAQALDDLRANNDQLREENKTLRQEVINHELAIAGLLRELGRPVEDTDLPLKPNC